jgi:F-type H+-transporting ATPase subunit delta
MREKEMTGASKVSLAAIRALLERSLSGKGAEDASRMARDLGSVVATLDSSTGLRRALSDQSRDGAAKAKLVDELFGVTIGKECLALIKEAYTLRWSTPSGLADALEVLSIEAWAAAAEAQGEGERLEVELFAVARTIHSSRELQEGIADLKYTMVAKSQLLTSIFGDVLAKSTKQVVDAFVTGTRGRSIERTLALYSNTVVARKERTIARVTSAVVLDEARQARLTAALEKALGRKIRVDVEVDPYVMGGISVRIGDELIDGTVINRLMEASRSLAGRAVR